MLQPCELVGDVVLAVELVISEDPQEDVLSKNVLEQHLADVGFIDGGSDASVAQLQELGYTLAVGVLPASASATA